MTKETTRAENQPYATLRCRSRQARGLRAFLASLVIVTLAATFASVAGAADTHVFDPDLSLTGNCATSVADTVPDPGVCPIPPGVPGVDHPPLSFSEPTAVTTDSYGNIYVDNRGSDGGGSQGRIDIFDPAGSYISTVKVPGPTQIAVDGDGVLYLVQLTKPAPDQAGEVTLSRIKPLLPYEPATGEIEYPDPATPEVIRENDDFLGNSYAALAIDPVNGHFFLKLGVQIVEYGSAAEGNPELEEFGNGIATENGGSGTSIAVDVSRNRIYASAYLPASSGGVVRVFELSAPHALVDTITASETPIPSGKFAVRPVIAADEGSGNVFVYDGGQLGSKLVYEFDEEGEYLSSLGQGTSSGEGKIQDVTQIVKIWVDNGANSPNGALNLAGRYLFVPSHPAQVGTGLGHVFAYGPALEFAPEVKALGFAAVTRDDAELQATVNSGNLLTDYAFEYISEQAYQEAGESFTGAEIAREGQLPAGKADVALVAEASGLAPGTAYRFRVVASNEKGTVEEERHFTTYAAPSPSPACANESLRTGPSALLPDCRAYELVTPADTNSRNPLGLSQLGDFFPSLQASPAGDKVSFQVEGGTIPGYEGTGSLAGDPYLSSRTAAGWKTSAAGPNGAEAAALLPGSPSPDQGFSLWSTANPSGSKVIDGKQTNYVRYPDGHSELVGRGSLLATDPRAEVQLISENGGHILFVSGTSVGPAIRLEENAPPAGTRTIYDRTGDEVTHVVSLLPGGATPTAGQDANYQGASYDGKGVAFTIGGTLYLRYDNQETYEVASGVTFAGVAEGGKRIFYLQGGNLKAFDVEEGVIDFTPSADVRVVNVASGGTAAYFVSPSVLGSEPNPNGAEPQAGEENLYLSREGQVSFVGTVTERDVKGENGGIEQIEGLGLWIPSVVEDRLGRDPSRTTPDGNVMLFESRADLTGYDPQGHAEVYRYDSAGEELSCLSCNPTGAPATGEASLQSLGEALNDIEPLSSVNRLTNVRADGARAFFQSEEPLVLEDSDGLQDVYEWEAEGVGSCLRPGGCVSLISSGKSAFDDYLFAVSDSGNDAFIRSGDLLAPAFDSDPTPSIYDARVEGGFAPPAAAAGECLGEACQPAASAPNDPTPASSAYRGAGNVSPEAGKRRCPKGKHAVRRGGKVRCVKKKKHAKHHHKRTRNHRRAGR
jgi:hypothetical protein